MKINNNIKDYIAFLLLMTGVTLFTYSLVIFEIINENIVDIIVKGYYLL